MVPRSARAKHTTLLSPLVLLLLLHSMSWASAQPSLAPVLDFSDFLVSAAPSGSTLSPTTTPLPSTIPPTNNPTRTASPSSSPNPSNLPTLGPSYTPSQHPTGFPTLLPTTTFTPSNGPTNSPLPSLQPTESPNPTSSPSSNPTITARPTNFPSLPPSSMPSYSPSATPTQLPTYSVLFDAKGYYFQSFSVANGRIFNDNETVIFEAIMEGYTYLFGNTSTERIDEVNITCVIGLQRVIQPLRRLGRGRRLSDTINQLEGSLNQVEYSVSWGSNHVNVTNFNSMFASFVNENTPAVTSDLQEAGLNVTSVSRVSIIQVTQAPSDSPTVSPFPSVTPTPLPTTDPTISISEPPSFTPTARPSSIATLAPTGGSLRIGTIVIIVSLVVVICILVIAFFVYLRYRHKQKEYAFQAAAAAGNAMNGENQDRLKSSSINSAALYPGSRVESPAASDDKAAGMISPADSMLSNHSLLSAGNSMGGESVIEQDGTHNLADEFDQYKDQNLERVRAEVEDNLIGSDGMMSHAMTLALMSDEDPIADPTQLHWGGTGDPIEIEASALCDIHEFLKRKEGASIGERKSFMQENMNKMVASVRHGVVQPAEASRTIHECAAMLGMELASELPENTVIVNGLRKNVTKVDLEDAFREFGDIDDAAVASSARGFGLVRFVSTQSAQRTLQRFRVGEIVVQDVAVSVRVLKSDGAMDVV